jgi:hypothetical protein
MFGVELFGSPRRALRHYPQLADYAALDEEFRPFVGFVHRTGYRSPAVNTDWLGLREHYDADGRFVDLADPSSVGRECNVLLGGSVAFGVGAGSDRATLASHLNEPGRPCLNLGLRGATSQQELALFIVLRPRLPRVRNAILLSGINECLLAALDRTLVFPEYGGSFTSKARLSPLDPRVLASGRDQAAQQWLGELAARAYSGSRAVRALARLASRDNVAGLRPRPSDLSFEDKLDMLLSHLEGTLETWAALQSAAGTRVHYVLQPVASWGERQLTPLEQELIAAERAEIPGTSWLEPSLHARVGGAVAAACERHGIAFHDANHWLSRDAFAGADVFLDHCHLTDAGNALLADCIRAELEWR